MSDTLYGMKCEPCEHEAELARLQGELQAAQAYAAALVVATQGIGTKDTCTVESGCPFAALKVVLANPPAAAEQRIAALEDVNAWLRDMQAGFPVEDAALSVEADDA